MRKKGDKGAPTSEQLKKAKGGHMGELAFDNPGEAMKKAREMGFDKVHNHKENGKDVFMPGPSHEALMKKVKETKAELSKEQKKLPPALQKVILKKKGKKPEDKKDDKSETKAYDMTQEEFDEVMNFEEMVKTKDDLLEAEAAKRPGKKSGAQTPAKPSEKKKGSSKNKKGSAGKGGPSITFSAKVTESLKNKVKEHNAKSKKKVTLSQLKKVYRRGAGAFSTSHRPGQSRGSWAMARVNMFLKMKRGGKVKKSYKDADGDI